MWAITPDLIVSVVGFGITFGTLLYTFGRLEGRILERLDSTDRRVTRLERLNDYDRGRV